MPKGGKIMTTSAPGREGLVLEEPVIFDLDRTGESGVDLPEMDVDVIDPSSLFSSEMLRNDYGQLPELTEPQVVRHFTRLSTYNYSLDGGFYPLGSCTMKYNPKVNEEAAFMGGFANAHPYLPENASQGLLQMMYELQEDLREISGMDAVSLHPAAGSHGELTGLMLIRAYFDARGETQRTKMIIPDSAHGTNPSSAAVCGLEAVEMKSGSDGMVDLKVLEGMLSDDVAGIMITNPNTGGVFEGRIKEICELVHSKGGLVYMDGANMNALVGRVRPGDFGVDVMHYNTHKTFSTPHGGGGPGAGPIAFKSHLEPFAPRPVVVKNGDSYALDFDRPQSIGKVRSFYGSIGVLVRAYTYIKTLGNKGLKDMTDNAVLNANYIKKKLEKHFNVRFPDVPCMHEVLLTEDGMEQDHISTMDIAKGLIEHGFHPPTVYFPLTVKGAMLIEPTESESRRTMDQFCETMIKLRGMSSEVLHHFPQKSFVSRVDEVSAARNPVLRYKKGE